MTEAIALIVGLILGILLAQKFGADTLEYVKLLLSTVADVLSMVQDENHVNINKIFRLIIEKLEDAEIDSSLIKDIILEILYQDN